VPPISSSAADSTTRGARAGRASSCARTSRSSSRCKRWAPHGWTERLVADAERSTDNGFAQRFARRSRSVPMCW